MVSFTGLLQSIEEIELIPWMKYWAWKRKKALAIVASAILLLLFGALIFWGIEKDEYKKSGIDFTYLDALYFSVETATTIGSGDYVPLTTGGKVFIVIYIIVAIALFTYALGSVTTHVVNSIDKQISKNLPAVMRRSLAANLDGPSSTDVIVEDSSSTNNNKRTEEHTFMSKEVFVMWLRLMSLFHPYKRYVIAILLNTLLVLIGAGLFVAAEGWSYGDAVYFCIITLSTVGFGDIVPTTNGGKFLFIVFALFAFATIGFIYGEIAAQTGVEMQKNYEKRFQESIVELPAIQDQFYQAQQQKKEKNAKDFVGSMNSFYEKLPNSNDQQYFLQLVEEFLHNTKPQ